MVDGVWICLCLSSLGFLVSFACLAVSLCFTSPNPLDGSPLSLFVVSCFHLLHLWACLLPPRTVDPPRSELGALSSPFRLIRPGHSSSSIALPSEHFDESLLDVERTIGDDLELVVRYAAALTWLARASRNLGGESRRRP
jgi:hypothetical protein